MSALSSACAPAGATDTPQDSVLRLELAQCHNGNEHRASAFAIEDGLALTVAHAFDDIDGFTVRTADGLTIDGDVVYLDIERDIAVLRLSGDAVPDGLTLRSTDEESSTDAAIATYAEAEGVELKDAEILRFVRLTLDGVGSRAGIEVAADINSGDSGGPMLDPEGRVIGMVFATSRQDERGWAIATAELERAVEDRADKPIELPCAPRP